MQIVIQLFPPIFSKLLWQKIQVNLIFISAQKEHFINCISTQEQIFFY